MKFIDIYDNIYYYTLRKFNTEGIITIDDMLLLRNIAVKLKDREKLKELYELFKMFYISTGSNIKIIKILNLLHVDINIKTWGKHVSNI